VDKKFLAGHCTYLQVKSTTEIWELGCKQPVWNRCIGRGSCHVHFIFYDNNVKNQYTSCFVVRTSSRISIILSSKQRSLCDSILWFNSKQLDSSSQLKQIAAKETNLTYPCLSYLKGRRRDSLVSFEEDLSTTASDQLCTANVADGGGHVRFVDSTVRWAKLNRILSKTNCSNLSL